MYKFSILLLICLSIACSPKTDQKAKPSLTRGSFIIEDLGKTYEMPAGKMVPGLYCHVPDSVVCYGNTSIRNEQASTLLWKGQPNSNGYGYFQRNRDLGQVINVPEGSDVVLDGLVFRTSLGSNAIMKGAAGAELTVVFFEVSEAPDKKITINENGTYKGDSATHGFDHQYNRCDDFIEGAIYTPIHVSQGGTLPEDLPTTTLPAHPKADNSAYEEQEGHLRYLKADFNEDSEITLEGGKRYAFILGFSEPGVDRAMALAIRTEVHTKENASFIADNNGKTTWGIRREGDGTLPPSMMPDSVPPSDPKAKNKLISESMFPKDHYAQLTPTSDGYPDVDTYRSLQFYFEVR